MPKKIRLIARLDVKDTNLVKGIQLEGLRKLGDPNAFAKEYYGAGIDELLYIDIVASLYNRNNLSDIVRKTVDDVYIPVCVGGGLRSVEDVRHILSMGADKMVASKIADRVGITRSVIVNALRKFESAGVIESRSSGMKGTYIKVLNDVVFQELDDIKKKRKENAQG